VHDKAPDLQACKRLNVRPQASSSSKPRIRNWGRVSAVCSVIHPYRSTVFQGLPTCKNRGLEKFGMILHVNYGLHCQLGLLAPLTSNSGQNPTHRLSSHILDDDDDLGLNRTARRYQLKLDFGRRDVGLWW